MGWNGCLFHSIRPKKDTVVIFVGDGRWGIHKERSGFRSLLPYVSEHTGWNVGGLIFFRN